MSTVAITCRRIDGKICRFYLSFRPIRLSVLRLRQHQLDLPTRMCTFKVVAAVSSSFNAGYSFNYNFIFIVKLPPYLHFLTFPNDFTQTANVADRDYTSHQTLISQQLASFMNPTSQTCHTFRAGTSTRAAEEAEVALEKVDETTKVTMVAL